MEKCKTCDGSGEVHSHNPMCLDCDGTGNAKKNQDFIIGQWYDCGVGYFDLRRCCGKTFKGTAIMETRYKDIYLANTQTKYTLLPECTGWDWKPKQYRTPISSDINRESGHLPVVEVRNYPTGQWQKANLIYLYQKEGFG